jgi:hypothetical protein
MRALFLPLAAALLTPDDARGIQRDALASSQAYATVQSLCDDVGPRMAGSAGDKAAVDWALRRMRAIGLTNVRAEKVRVTRWERGDARAEIVSPVSQVLTIAALGGSVGTPAGGVQGDVVEAASLDALKKMSPADVRGKIVFLNQAMRRTRDGAGYGEAVRGRLAGAGEAAKLGAVAMLLRSIGTDHDRIAHTGAKLKDSSEIPAAALSVPDAELLHRVLEEKKAARVRLALGARTVGDADSANVIGEVPGRQHPEEIVLVGAHLDSWDLGTGAIDDGAGVAIALETGRLIASRPQRPRRTVRIVLFANEEHGIDGAREYARAHASEVPLHVAATEADLGADAVYAVRWQGDPAARARFVEIARLLGPLGVEEQDAAARGGADLGPLKEQGVPVLDLLQDATRYFDIHHTANDTLDKVDPGVLSQAAAVYATAAWALAEMDGNLGRVPEAARKTH